MRLSHSLYLAAFTAVSIFATDAFAAGADYAKDGAEKAGGLPQMDPTWFASQLFWLVVLFAALYFVFAKTVLPNLSSTLENRREHIQGDLDSADSLKKEAEKVHQDYETILEEARAKASKLYQDIDEDIKAKSEKEYADFQDRLVKETQAVEAKILAAKQEAMAGMNDIAAEVAKEAAEKVVGIKPTLKSAKDAVQSIAGGTTKTSKAA